MELGEPNVDTLLEVAKDVKPSVVVCPDAFRDADQTLELFHNYSRSMSEVAGTLMFVPQGSNLVEWCDCAAAMIAVAQRRRFRFIVGIPKVLNTFAGGRWSALAWMNDIYPEVGTHLLGTWYGMNEVLELNKWFDNIIGFDTTLPYALGLRHFYVNMHCGTKATLNDEEWYYKLDDIEEEALWITEINIASIRKLLERSVQAVPYMTDLKHTAMDPSLEKQMRFALEKLPAVTKPEKVSHS
jgi:hypothetical protein